MKTSELLQRNLGQIAEANPNIIGMFYGLLFERYPEAKSLFGRHSQAEQERMLGEALTALVMHLDDADFVERTMLAIGRRHVAYGVEDHMYPWVGECLLETMKRGSGDAWNTELEEGWAAVIQAVASIALRGAAMERAAA